MRSGFSCPANNNTSIFYGDNWRKHHEEDRVSLIMDRDFPAAVPASGQQGAVQRAAPLTLDSVRQTAG